MGRLRLTAAAAACTSGVVLTVTAAAWMFGAVGLGVSGLVLLAVGLLGFDVEEDL